MIVLGSFPGEVEVVADGTGIHIGADRQTVRNSGEEAGGRLVINASGVRVDDEMVRSLRLAEQRGSS